MALNKKYVTTTTYDDMVDFFKNLYDWVKIDDEDTNNVNVYVNDNCYWLKSQVVIHLTMFTQCLPSHSKRNIAMSTARSLLVVALWHWGSRRGRMKAVNYKVRDKKCRSCLHRNVCKNKNAFNKMYGCEYFTADTRAKGCRNCRRRKYCLSQTFLKKIFGCDFYIK